MQVHRAPSTHTSARIDAAEQLSMSQLLEVYADNVGMSQEVLQAARQALKVRIDIGQAESTAMLARRRKVCAVGFHLEGGVAEPHAYIYAVQAALAVHKKKGVLIIQSTVHSAVLRRVYVQELGSQSSAVPKHSHLELEEVRHTSLRPVCRTNPMMAACRESGLLRAHHTAAIEMLFCAENTQMNEPGAAGRVIGVFV